MSRRVLILSASVGAGHLRAAEAVELAVRELDPQALVENVDVLKLTNAVFRRVYGQAYLDLANKLPHVLGYFYDLLDRKPSPRQKSDTLRRLVQRMHLGRFLKFLKKEPWDVVVNTHFLPAEIIAGLKRKKQFKTPQITTVSDFETHRLWVNEPCEQYFTATEEAALHLHSWGVPESSISITGIPIHPAFNKPKPREQCLKRHGLRGDRPIVLQLSGGFGVGPIERIYRAILDVEVPLEIVVVSGRNAKLKSELEKIDSPSRHTAHVLGFTTEIDELMAAADVVVSKPGGLTTSEVLASGAAMAIINPIPGQESRNSDFLLENGAGIKLNNLSTVPFKLASLLNEPRRLAALKANARRLGRPRAAFDVARRALELAG
ncbi:MAG TPA: glycosyltransferase [Pirellulales bacterium]|jgi:processive 1,2-diacylglycerol beta-glucosyltransferase|nr:glycosyltransferase [Pirellulales bacterium]